MNIAGTWTTKHHVTSLVIAQDGNNLLSNWLVANASWQVATGTLNGDQISMSFNGGTPLGGTVSADGNTISWNNGGIWYRFRLQ